MSAPTGEEAERRTRAQLAGCGGCGGVVLSVLVLLALTVVRSDRTFFDDPAQVEATLQAIVPCQLPRGYRPYRGAHAGGQRLVQAVPETFRGEQVPLSSALLIAVWSFPSGTPVSQAQAQALEYWTQLVGQRLGAPAADGPADQAVELPLRGGAVAAVQRDLPGAGVPLRLVVVAAPRAPGGAEPVAFSFLGAAPRFDRAALLDFLGSVR